MKIFHLGSACGHDMFSKIVKQSRNAPSQSAQNFETALLDGLSQIEGVELTANSFYSIAPFPHGCLLGVKSHTEQIGKCDINILPMINLPIIKQLCMSVITGMRLKKWIKANQGEEKCVSLYGIYPASATKVLRVCKRYGVKTFAFITDAPKMMYTYKKESNRLLRIARSFYRNKALKIQSTFDGYIYITEAMSQEVAPGKPYVVLEVICDEHIFDGIVEDKAEPKAIMYAGMLHQLFGIRTIIDAFCNLKGDYQLWLFGDGDMVEEIKNKTKEDSRIKYMGRVDRETVLRYEKKASLLVNIRSVSDEYTKYSFPSKTIEYMLSGTPMISSKLPGIPLEYYNYIYMCENTDPFYLAELFSTLLSDPKIKGKGESARQFAIENKNAYVGAKKVVAFFESQLHRG